MGTMHDDDVSIILQTPDPLKVHAAKDKPCWRQKAVPTIGFTILSDMSVWVSEQLRIWTT